MTLKNGFGKCSLFVLSANGWIDQNMASSFSRQRKPFKAELSREARQRSTMGKKIT